MKGNDLFLGLNYVDVKYVQEAETLRQLPTGKRISFQRALLIAAVVGLMLFLMGCAVVALVRMRVEPARVYGADGQAHTGVEIRFEETGDTFLELGAYYPQRIPEGYTMTFVSQGVPLQRQYVDYENEAGLTLEYIMMIGDPSSNVEIYDILGEETVDINGAAGILYEQTGGSRTLVWALEKQGWGFVLRTDDPQVDLLDMARSTAQGEPLTPTRSDSTVKALEELGDWCPSYLPEGYEEQGVMGCPLEEGGGWYSYVNKHYVNKEENTRIFFAYETYSIAVEDGYVDNAETACSLFIPGSNILEGVVLGEETEIAGMFALKTETRVVWADPEEHKVYYLHSEDVLGEELLRIAQSIVEIR